MKKILLASVIALATISPAFAWGTDVTTPPPAPAPIVNNNWSHYLSAMANQAQAQSQGQQQTSSNRNRNTANGGAGGNSNVGNSGNSTVNFQPNRALAASAFAPSFAGSAPCAGPAQSAGLQIPWVGGSEGTQDMDEACQLERNGDARAARYRLCLESDKLRRSLYQEAQDRAVGGEVADPCPDDREKFAKWWFDSQPKEAPAPLAVTPVKFNLEHCLHPSAAALRYSADLRSAFESQPASCRK